MLLRSKNISYSKTFINGLFVGCLVSITVYFISYDAFLSSSGVEFSEVNAENFEVKARGAHKRSSDEERNKGEEVSHNTSSTSPTPNARSALTFFIPISWVTVEVYSESRRKTWWENYLKEGVTVLGTADKSLSWKNIANMHYAKKCSDFYSFSISSRGWWSPSQLTCLLEDIHSNFNPHDWSIILSPYTYLSVPQLKRILSTLNPGSIVYMGQPDPAGHCNGGPGIVLSRRALKSIIPYLSTCLNTTGRGESRGDVLLGQCFMTHLDTTCYDLDAVERYFIDKRDYEFVTEDLEKPGSLLTTIYPVYSDNEMKSLFRADLLREIRFHFKKADEEAEALYNSQICKPSYYKPQVEPVLKDNNLLQWSTFQPPVTFSDQVEPNDWFDGDIKMEIGTLAQDALKQFCIEKNINLTLEKITYGMHRYLGVRGKEYMIDILTKEHNIPIRLHVLRPHSYQPIVLEDSPQESLLNDAVNFVVPLSNVKARFGEFMETYQHVCLKNKEECRLHLVVYGERDLYLTKKSIKKYKEKYPSAVINTVLAKGEFSRGKTLHLGISTLMPSDLFFTCDVDITLERRFLNRCRRNTIQGQRVYYPEVFKYYNMDYVYRDESKPNSTYQINRSHGHWCTYGYGMACMYKSDYDLIGGFDMGIKGWGGEDVKLVESALRHGYDVMRAPDPSLSHRFHYKACSRSLSHNQHAQCVASRNEDIADRRRLADYVLHLNRACGVKKHTEEG